MISLDKKKMQASKIDSGKVQNKLISYGETAKNFETRIKNMIAANVNIVKWGIGNAVILALLAIAQAIPVVNVIADAISLMAGLCLGGGIEAGDITMLAGYIINFIESQNYASSCFNQL